MTEKRDNAEVAKEIEDRAFFLEGVRNAEIAAKLRQLMKAKGLDMEDMVERIGIFGRGLVQDIMAGAETPRLHLLYRLAEAVESELVISFKEQE